MKKINLPLSKHSLMFEDMDKHYKTLISTLPGVVYTLDEKGHFAYISDSIESVLGYTPHDLIGLHFSNIVHPEDIPVVSRDFILPKFNGIATGDDNAPKLFDERRSPERRTNGLQARLISKKTKNQKRKTLTCKINAAGQHISNGESKFLGTVGLIFDFSTEDMVSSKLEKKRSYNPFELLSQAMRHTFSNVFTGIYGNLQLIEMQMGQNQDYKPNIEAIKSSVESAVEVVKQLSNIASDSIFSKDSRELATVVKDIATELFSEKDVELKFASQPDLYPLDIEADYAKHIIRSILFLIRETVAKHCIIQIETKNALTIPSEIPRLDCKYIEIRVEISDVNVEQVEMNLTPELDRVAATSLGYLLLKKNGGLVKVLSEKVIALYLPSSELH